MSSCGRWTAARSCEPGGEPSGASAATATARPLRGRRTGGIDRLDQPGALVADVVDLGPDRRARRAACPAAGTSRPDSDSRSSLSGSSHVAHADCGRITGIRSWIGAIVPLADVVTTVALCSQSASGPGRLVAPRRPQPGDRERFTVEAVDEHRLLGRLAGLGDRAAGLAGLPLVEAVHRDDAAGLLEHALVGRLLGERLGAGVDHLGPDLALLRPHRDQPPVEHLEARRAVGPGDDGIDVVRRCDVVVLAQRLAVERGAEVLGDLVGRARGHEATAHRFDATGATGTWSGWRRRIASARTTGCGAAWLARA